MNIRNYTQKEEQAVVDLWNRALPFDGIDVSKFRRQAILDENFDPELAFVAEEEGRITGFLFGTKRRFPYLERGLEPDRGWINVLFVDPDYQRRGIGSCLLKACEEKLAALGCKNITLGAYSPNYFFWGIDPENHANAAAFFEKHGYQAQEKHYSMAKDLHGYQIPAPILEKKAAAEAKGYRFLPFDYSYTLELLEFLRTEFGGVWKRNALIAMQEGTAEDLIWLILAPEGSICGFCMRAIDRNPMRFGPIGIAASRRNEGLGTILLDLQCLSMCQKGIYHMYFVTTDDPGRRYYERQGLHVFRTFVTYKKMLTQKEGEIK